MTFITRAYNTWTFYQTHGTVKKSSSTQRIKDEINYYLNIPDRFKILFPRLIDYNVEEGWLILEKYSYDDLGKSITSKTEKLNTSYWEEVFFLLRDIIEEWKTETSVGEIDDCNYMYLIKTETEVNNFKEQHKWYDAFKYDELKINGTKCQAFHIIWPSIREILIKELIPTYVSSFIHGDMGLCNILYKNGIARFIDPRGSFGKSKIYGDYRYDIGKLYHSVDGAYEYLNNNMFSIVQVNSNEWVYTLDDVFNNRIIAKEVFESVFFTSKNHKKEALIIEGLIHVGAAARHYENPDRQIALFLIGLANLNRALQ